MIESISAVTLATHIMLRAVRFYCGLGFAVHAGGEQARFTTLHAGAETRRNLSVQPNDREWGWWGRILFYVSDATSTTISSTTRLTPPIISVFSMQ